MISYIYNYFLRLITTDLFNFSGAEGRLTFFLFHVNLLLSNAIITVLLNLTKDTWIVLLVAALALIYIIVCLIANVSLIVRRLRDMNTNVFLFFLIFVPGINIILFLFLLFYPGERSI